MDRRCSAFLVLAAASAFSASAPPLDAQRLRGTVVLPDSTTPARGVIVVATGDNGASVSRALTNARGGFDLPLPHAGRYDVRVLRIGYRPTVVPALELAAGENRQLRVILAGTAIALARVTVRGQDVCRTRPDSGALVARAWEEARKALMASQLSALEAPLVAEWIVYDRSLDASGRIVREQKVHTTTAPTTHAFKSWPAESLATRGYIVADSEAATHYAPDADVLLSESFASLHCFRMEPPPTGLEELVGVGFRPVREQRGLSDIEGTLWLDRATAELKWLEYRYTNVPAAAERAGVGGKVEFLLLKSGSWLVSRWSIRMARLGAPEGLLGGTGARRVIAAPPTMRSSVTVAPPEATLRGVSVAGGQVTRIHRGDSLVYEAIGARFDAQLVSVDTMVPVAGAVVTLTGSDYATQADSLGRARLQPVLEGRYRARVQTALMEAIGASLLDREVEVREGVARVDSIALPAAVELLRSACGSEAVKPLKMLQSGGRSQADRSAARIVSMAASEALLYGTVRDSLGHVAANAAVTVTWQGPPKIYPGAGAQLAVTEQTRGVLADDRGRWRLCGMPLQTPLVVRIATDLGAAEQRTRIEDEMPVSALDLVVHPVVAASAEARREPDGVVLEISVSDRGGAPLSDVTLDVTPQGGSSRRLVTNEHGRTLLVDLRPGRLFVRARSVGYKAGELAVSVAPGRNTAPIILDKVRAPALDTVRVMGSRPVLARHSEFEARRINREATASITSEEIDKRNPASTWQMLTNVPSIKISDRFEHGEFVVVATMMRGIRNDFSDAPCYAQVVVDGIALATDITGRPNLNNLPPPSDIHGIEVFAGAASIPLKYTGAGAGKWCGLIAIWTK